MQVEPALNVQTIPVHGSGDLAAGEFEPTVGDRTPPIKGLP